jgi:carotenoid 1,2-hydratase
MSFALPNGPDFSEAIPSGGYIWWYLDGMSDDGKHGITLIAFVGSVFSPYYRRALKRGAADPEDHVAINVALYGPQGRWTMTERGKRQLSRGPDHFRVGPSSLAWSRLGQTGRGQLGVAIDERAAPIPFPVRGTVRLIPQALTGQSFALDDAERHHWRPIAPRCRIEVDFSQPSLRWSGSGYLDSNRGERLPEHDFVDWDWSRAPHRDGTAILYDMRRREGGRKMLALDIGPHGTIASFDPPPRQVLPSGRIWRAHRGIQSEADFAPQVLETLEDTPFYARSIVRTKLLGETVTSFHESLMLDRLRQPWVQTLLPFRMPRWTR